MNGLALKTFSRLLVGLTACVFVFGLSTSSVFAIAISEGQTISSVQVDPRASIFGVHGQTPSNDSSGIAAVEFTFTPGVNNVFTFSVTGTINCCNGTPLGSPDGENYTVSLQTSITSFNGLSGAAGNNQLPTLGVFTDGSPNAGAVPTTLTWDSNNPTNLSPELHQIYYIGDGRAGYDDSNGATLLFTAPAGATTLFIGFADSFEFTGAPILYNDNTGVLSADVTLVPAPVAGWLFVSALGLLGGLSQSWRGAKNRA